MTEIEEQSSKHWWSRSRWIAALVAVLVLAGIGTTLVLTVFQDDDARPTIDPSMLVAAREEATNFFTLDYQNADASINRVLDLATGTFKDEYTARKAEVIAQLKAKKLICTASIPDGGAATEFVNGDQAQVLVVVVVPESATCHPDDPRNRTRILLSRIDGRWLVSGVNKVG